MTDLSKLISQIQKKSGHEPKTPDLQDLVYAIIDLKDRIHNSQEYIRDYLGDPTKEEKLEIKSYERDIKARKKLLKEAMKYIRKNIWLQQTGTFLEIKSLTKLKKAILTFSDEEIIELLEFDYLRVK